eukprot:PhF_6_TR42976/c0_g1_i1/m.65453
MKFHNARVAYRKMFVLDVQRTVLQGTSLWIFPSEGFSKLMYFRQVCAFIVASLIFEIFMLCAILVSLVFLWMSPDVEDSISSSVDIVFAILFAVEMVAKWIAWGLCVYDGGRESYMQSNVNRCDFIVVVTGILSLFFPPIRAIRVLRVLRLVMRSQNIRTVGRALVYSMKGVTQAFLFSIVIWFIFGIIGVSFFKGDLVECTDPGIQNRSMCVGTMTVTILNVTSKKPMNVSYPREWVSKIDNFDHIGNAMFLLFKVVMQEQWAGIMFSAMDSGDESTSGIKNSRSEAAFYFVIFVVIGKFFAANMVVGTLLNSFQSMKMHVEGSNLLTPLQRMWVKSRRIARDTKLTPRAVPPLSPKFSEKGPKPKLDRCYRFRRRIGVLECELCGTTFETPELFDSHSRWFSHWCYYCARRVRQLAFHICESNRSKFDGWMAIFILLNAVVLMLQHYNQNSEWDQSLFWINTFFLIVFTAEIIIRCIAVTPLVFVMDSWNQFDFVVVLISIIAFGFGTNTTIVRVVRMVRLFRLVKKLKGLQTIGECIVLSLPAFLNVGLLLFVTFFTFGVVGVTLFGNIRRSENGLTEYTNFETTGNAVLTLFQLSTTEGWPQVLQGCRLQPPYCSNDFNDCGTEAAIPYFVIFMIVGSFIMINLIIAVVLENFSESQDAMSMHGLAVPLQEFKELWLDFDPKATGKLPTMRFLILLRTWHDRYGHYFESQSTNNSLEFLRMMSFLEILRIPVDANDQVRYSHCVPSLFRCMFNVSLEEILQTAKDSNHYRLAKIVMKDSPNEKFWDVRHSLAQSKISRNWRRKLFLRLVAASGSPTRNSIKETSLPLPHDPYRSPTPNQFEVMGMALPQDHEATIDLGHGVIDVASDYGSELSDYDSPQVQMRIIQSFKNRKISNEDEIQHEILV